MSVYVGRKRIYIPIPHTSRWDIRFNVSFSSLLLLLIAMLVAGLMLLPPIYLVVRSAETIEASLSILTKPTTAYALGRTILLAAAVTFSSCLIAIPSAWLVTSTDLKFRRFWSIALTLPLVLPSYVGAYLFVSLLGPKGLLQKALGVSRLPSLYGFWGALFVLTLLSYPYIFLTVRATFKRLDPTLSEAARSLGQSPWQTFWRVTFPSLRPGIVAGGLLVALYVIRDFGAVSMLRYDTFTRIIFIQYKSFSDRALSATLGLVLIALTATLLWLETRTRGRAHYNRQSIGCARQSTNISLGRWQAIAQLYLGSILTVALLLPTMGLIYWFTRGLAHEQTLTNLGQAAWGSFSTSFMAALIAVIAALPVAILSVRRNDKLSRWLEQLTYVGYALPGIVVALAVTFFSIRYTNAIYGSGILLIVAYVILFIPQAVSTARTSLLQMPDSIEEAGRSLGHHKSSIFRRITLPLVSPGILAGGILVFLTCMKELPATLILSPYKLQTLSMTIWSSIDEAYFAQAAAPSLLLILLSAVALYILTAREK